MFNNIWQFTPGTWNDYPCHKPLPYICKAQISPENPPEPDPPACPYEDHSTFSFFHNSCYKFVDQPMDWESAQKYCVSQRSNLMSANDIVENSYAYYITPQDAWLGLSNRKVRACQVIELEKVRVNF